MDFVLFVLFSVLESFAMFYLVFKTFKIDVYPLEILFSGFIMAFFSFVLRNVYGWVQVDIIVQFFLVFCFLWLLFKIHIFYAIIMTGLGYQAYMLIQSLIFLAMSQAGVFSLNNSYMSYLLQFLSAGMTIGIANYLAKKRKGFDFIPDKPRGKIHINKREKILFALTLPSILIILSTFYFATHFIRFFTVIPFLYAVVLYVYLYHSYKKDRGEHEHFSL